MRRTSLILGFTALAPVAILAATVTAGQLRQQSAEAVSRALAAARAVNARVDGELMADDAALRLIDVRVIDHLIVTGSRVISFAEEGLM